MFKGTSLSFRLYAGFAAVLLIVCLLGAFAYIQLKGIRSEITSLDDESIPGIILVADLESLVKETETLIVKHILAEKDEMDKLDAELMKHRQEATETLKSFEKAITTAKERELYEHLTRELAAYVAVVDNELLPLSREGKKKEAIEVLHGSFVAVDEKYLDAMKELHEFIVAEAEETSKTAEAHVAAAVTGIIIGLLAALFAGAAVGIFLSRSISSALNTVINSLTSGSEQVSSASNQVSQSSQQMAEGASEQASSLEETSASLEELSSMTRQNSDNARQASTMATDTRDAVEKSREAMTRMGDAIGKIKGSSDQTAKIIKTIDEIAFQTNLLALNAAVEAARAGDAGKGFAVVAEEVRNLAQRSAEAAKSTAALIEESQQNANNGVAVSNEVAGILSRIVESVSKLTQLIGEVSVASEEQTKGITQIGTAVTEMDKLTQSNAANAEESASASEELAAQAKELGEMVTVLVGIVKGESARAASAIGAGRLSFRPSAKASMSRAAAPKASKAAASAKPSHDWSPAPTHAPANALAAHGGRKAAGSGKTMSPDQVIPMDDSDLKDF